MNAILRLYPRAWRERYGDEVEALLDEHPASLLDQLDLIRGALDARLHPQVPGTDVAPEQEIPMDRKLLGILAAIGGLVWIGAVASMFVLPMGSDGYRQADLAFLGFAASYVLIGVALGLLGTRPGSSQSRMTGLVVVVISIVFVVLALIPWPIFVIPIFGFPILAVIAAARGSRNGVLPLWIVVAFFVGAVGLFAGSTGGIESDLGLALFSLLGVAALLLGVMAFTGRANAAVVSPA
jgi:hypothetical protein